MTEEDTEKTVLDALDFDAPVVCEWWKAHRTHVACGNDVEWLVVTSCCGYSAAFCGPHRESQIRVLSETGVRRWYCRACAQVCESIRWIPIGGAV